MRLEREFKCRSEESDKPHPSVPTSCIDPLQSKLGFSHMHMSILASPRSGPLERRTMASRKEQLSSRYALLEPQSLFTKSFLWGSEGPSSLKETQTVKKNIFVDDRLWVTTHGP